MGTKILAAEAAERRKVRRTMDQLEEMSEYDWGYCIGMEGLMGHFGRLIAEQVDPREPPPPGAASGS